LFVYLFQCNSTLTITVIIEIYALAEDCNQDYVNFFVGVWWALSLIASLTVLFIKEIKKEKKFDPLKRGNYIFPNDEEPLLEEDHASPIGYKVPHLPEFPVNPSYTHKGLGSCCCCFYQVGIEYALGLIVAIAVGGFICYLGVSHLDEAFMDKEFLSNVF
jgi:hypothetical protein